MSLQDVETLGYAVITDKRGRAGDKAIHVLGIPAAERTRERRPEQTTDPRHSRAGSQVDHVGAPYPRFGGPKHYGDRPGAGSPQSTLKPGHSEASPAGAAQGNIEGKDMLQRPALHPLPLA
jgi:hypothetical protein